MRTAAQRVRYQCVVGPRQGGLHIKLMKKKKKKKKTTRVDFVNGNSRTNVCSAHFEDGDFENLFKWRMKWSNRLHLKKIAVPSRKPAKENVCPLTGL